MRIPGRFINHGTNGGAVSQEHPSSPREVDGTRIHHQREEIITGAVADPGPSGLHIQHPQDGTLGPQVQDSRPSPRGDQDEEQGSHDSEESNLVRGKAMATTWPYSRKADDTQPSLAQELGLRHPGAQWTDTVLLTAEAEDNLNGGSTVSENGMASLDPVAPGDGRVYGRVGQGWGDCDRRIRHGADYGRQEEPKLHINWKEIQMVFLAVTLPCKSKARW